MNFVPKQASMCLVLSAYVFRLSLPYCGSLWRKHPKGKVLPRISKLVRKVPPDSTFFKSLGVVLPEFDALLFFFLFA